MPTLTLTLTLRLTPTLSQCIRDGKSIIIEGLHLDPGLFLHEFGDPRGEPALLQAGSLDPPLLDVPAAAAPKPSAAAAAEAAGEQLAGLQASRLREWMGAGLLTCPGGITW